MDLLARTLMTISCRDCDAIPKVGTAGRVLDGGVQVMHNGLKVVAGGYYGDWMAHIIRALRGHHEPQEERLYHHILQLCRHNTLMVELGAFWAYYSLWYLDEIPGSRAICVEPDPNNIAVGRHNAALNALEARAEFVEASIGGAAAELADHLCESIHQVLQKPRLDMTALLERARGQPIELLHIDAQGFELPFLSSVTVEQTRDSVRFLVVSTHHQSISGSSTTHHDCIERIRLLGGTVLAEHSVTESFSGDGLIIASFAPQDRALVLPQITRNTEGTSIF